MKTIVLASAIAVVAFTSGMIGYSIGYARALFRQRPTERRATEEGK